MCPHGKPASGGFTLLELLIVLIILGIMVAVGAGALPLGQPLRDGAQLIVTAVATARSRALLLNAPVTLELSQEDLELRFPNGDQPVREKFPHGMTVLSVNEESLLASPKTLRFLPLGVVQEHVVLLQSGRNVLSVYVPATGTARILDGTFSLEQIRKEFL